ncbi:hypothetical protein JHS3_06470 [Jeongeupia sp. HS-3]|uniref:TetR/AcrR family transcriptional regulator n=1 Tax=Jeongeupia sp. HS-3 TaxID=1009682 RepID=UPI0018A4F6C5|nr:TetR/AcrR family transcriptional regulator [Jeongeupia sp. HS-3]BCL74911.1 hypothetical protein JHS3_06470 [Jeongeupia sp. HS-3]
MNDHDPLATRQKLLDATVELLFADGYARLSEPRLCEHVDLTRGALRHHFPQGKYDLLPALVDQLFERTLAGVLKHGGNTPLQRFRLLLEYLQQAPECNLLVLLMELWIGSQNDPRLATAVLPRFQHWLPHLFTLMPGERLPPELLKLRFTLHGAILHLYGNNANPDDFAAAIALLLEDLQ